MSPTHSNTGNLQDYGNIYSSKKKGSENPSDYLNLWRAGELTGVCDNNSDLFNHDFAISDNIAIEDFGSYDTAYSQLSLSGKSRLDNVLERINQYDDVVRIELYDLHDKSTVSSRHGVVDKARITILASYLRSHLKDSTRLSIASDRERQDLRSRLSKVKKVIDGKVIVRVLANSVKRKSSSITFCTVSKRVADTQPSGMLHMDTNDRLIQNDGVFDGPMTLSMGDRVRLRVPEDTDIEGIYEIGSDGNLDVPYISSVRAVGLKVSDLEKKIARKLVDEAIIRDSFAMVDVSVLQWSVADVFVSGAVFNPGRKTINGLNTELKVFKQTQYSGDAARERFLSNALVSAGGVRPDADISNIVLRRRGKIININLEGIISGNPVTDISLITGDEVFVPTTGRFREELARVSQITPQGLRLFVSNLTTPRNPSQVDSDATKLPYGTRLLHVLLSANCVGGTQLTNSAKKALLITVNPLTQVTEAIERDIQQIVNNPDINYINPYLMPNDGVACYDSNITNFRDFARTFTDFITPFSLLKILIGN